MESLTSFGKALVFAICILLFVLFMFLMDIFPQECILQDNSEKQCEKIENTSCLREDKTKVISSKDSTKIIDENGKVKIIESSRETVINE